ncbi:MAG: glycosyltransferase family 4 protein [Rhodospirillaceae bacterium]|jgi:glycosyltransferase involved in cell wall biosynthesis|nr:glycosyltransferase family 4 protein [Rhodospirillaceae bacterium]MBT5564848.1 glycosyltransferase family 4 protein [Rhodospirillaceae bacterium]MBT6089188.1 glycosyltransferase family 4 protein [Rhodospirillaceae bacterium]
MGTGGVERGTIEVAEALTAAGWRSLVASQGGPHVRELVRVGAEHITLPLASKSPRVIRQNAAALSDLITHRSVSLVHARSRAPAWSAFVAANRTNTPFVTTFHGVYGLGPFGLKKLYNRVMARGEPVIAISKFIADHLIREYGVDESRLRLIPRGVDLSVFDPDTVSSARMVRLATEWRLPDDGPVIMLPGRLTSWKGQGLLIDALSVLKKSGRLHDGLRCLMVGPGSRGSSYRQRVETKLASTGLDGHVQIIEDCRDIVAAYMMTDVIVSASTRPEAFGRIVAEGQAMGRPVVAPAHGAAPEILLPGVTGWLFTPGDAPSLAGALEQALGVPAERRDELAAQARSHIAEHFDRDMMTSATLAVYEDLVSTRSKGAV